MLSDFLAAHDEDGGDDGDEGEGNEDDKRYLGKANLNMTQKFLQKKQKMQEAAGQTAKKEVDRKASKNRKIRYVVHDKIVNFCTPLDNLIVFDGRDAIVNNLFGVGTSAGKPTGLDKRQVIGDGVKLI